MSDPIEIRIHGRGGQGTVTLAALIVDAAFRAGWWPLGFPSFGTERTGAPVSAFVRLDKSPVRDRSEVRSPSVVVVQDPTLTHVVDVMAGATNATLIVNARSVPAGLPPGTVVVAASSIAMQRLGRPITSTAMLGAFAGATGLVGIDAVTAAIESRFAGDVGARNVAVAREAFDSVAVAEAIV